MAFLAALIQTIFKMVVVGAVAFGGIILGKFLRKRHDEKQSES